jgi:hypothetical protein
MGESQFSRRNFSDLATWRRGGEDAVVRRDHELGQAVRLDAEHRAAVRMREGLRHRGAPALSRPDLYVFDQADGAVIDRDFRVGRCENIEKDFSGVNCTL